MGNNSSHFQQRKDNKKQTAKTTSQKKACYYQLLGVTQTASPEEIKKAFRQRALQLHPDKNQHRIAEATDEFAAVQHAYQTLLDPHERVWYDRHRESILGGGGEADEGDAPGVDELMHFFQPGVYKGFEDDSNGFFSVYRELFEYLEEFEVEDGELGRGVAYTSFGSKKTPYQPSIVAFYDKWLSFQSTRKFQFVEKYQEEYADNRRIRRSMAKENQKLREQQRKQYSETVRELAGFIQKRDPRFKAYQEAKKKERDEAEKLRKKEQKQQRAQAMQDFVQPEWSQDVDDEKLAHLLDQMETNFDSEIEDEEEEEVIYECIVCKKFFKNQQQWLNHCQSKKHRLAVSKLGYDPYAFDFEEEEPEISDVENEDLINEDIEEIKESVTDDNFNHSKEDKVVESVTSESDQEEKPKSKTCEKKKTTAKKKPRRKPKEEREAKIDLKCNVCGSEFDSRNQLFIHIKEEGHALYSEKKKSCKKK